MKRLGRGLSNKYVAVLIHSVAGKQVVSRIPIINRSLRYHSLRLVAIVKNVKLYNAFLHRDTVVGLPLLYEYGFLKLYGELSLGDVGEIIKNSGVSLDILGFLNKNDAEWLEVHLDDKSIIDVAKIGTDFSVGDDVRIVSGPFSGHMGLLVRQINNNSYIIDLAGLKLHISKHLIRSLDYGLSDKGRDCFYGFD